MSRPPLDVPRLRRVPRQARSRERLARMLDAAEELLVAEGPGALTTTRVASAAGVSVGSLYQYLPDKEAIVEALAGRYLAEFEGLMEALAIHPSGNWFVMAGRVVTGDWNCGLFSLGSGDFLHGFKTVPRVTGAAFSPDGSKLYLAGTHGQEHKDGKSKPFGRVLLFELA